MIPPKTRAGIGYPEGLELTLPRKARYAIEALRQHGHIVTLYELDGHLRIDIDGRLLATGKDLEELANRLASLIEVRAAVAVRRAVTHDLN